MIAQALIAILVILGLLAGWIAIQHWARSFAARHPELGPAREEGEGCGALICLCRNKANCPKQLIKRNPANNTHPHDHPTDI